MTNILLTEGHDISYSDLTERLQEGQTLVAVWLHSSDNFPNAQSVTDEGVFDLIRGKAVDGFYTELRWFVSTTGSTNHFDYRA